MKKIYIGIVLLSASFFSLNSNAQNYYHGVGAQYQYGAFISSGSTDVIGVPAIMYKSTFGFKAKNMNFGISAYPSAGFLLSSGSSYLGAEIPILGEIYFGDIDDRCFYTGIGFSASYLANDDYSGSILGPQFEIGGQFSLGDRLYGIRGAYTHGGTHQVSSYSYYGNSTVHEEKRFLISLGFYYVLGQ